MVLASRSHRGLDCLAGPFENDKIQRAHDESARKVYGGHQYAYSFMGISRRAPLTCDSSMAYSPAEAASLYLLMSIIGLRAYYMLPYNNIPESARITNQHGKYMEAINMHFP